MDIKELDYSLPEELIAQTPCTPRDAARMLVVDREKKIIQEDIFRNISRYLRAGDCLVLNDTRVIRARLRGVKPTGGKVEIFLLHECPDAPQGTWEALVRPSAKVREGTTIHLPGEIQAIVLDRLPRGRRIVQFTRPDVLDVLEKIVEIPLPPYIRRSHPTADDGERYQTVYAAKHGAVAAPTAGLHFTPQVFEQLEAAGIHRAWLTLHVGYGTFRPIQTEKVEEHVLEPETFILPEETCRLLNQVRQEGGRVIAVGTTVTRTLESQYQQGAYRPGSGTTAHYIYPPYTFRAVDILQTNFHLPRSSLLALVCAFGGRDLIMEAYHYAIKKRFRFYSYGDVMLIL